MSIAMSITNVPLVSAASASLASSGVPDPFRSLAWAAIARGWDSQREEYSYFVPAADITGRIPPDLVATVFRNGPGLNDVYGTKLVHPIDGDGLIAAISFLPVTDACGVKKVHFRSRFVRSEHHLREREARKFMFRGQMGTQATSSLRDTMTTIRDVMTGSITPLQYRNPSNTNVFYWGGKLLSCYETGLPYSLDPRTLATLGQDDLGGALTHGTMAAHFRYDSARERLVVISLRPGLRKGSTLSICEFDRAWHLLQKQIHRIPFLNYVHDFVLTPHFYVFHITPFVKISRASVYEVATGASSPGQQMRYYEGLPSRMVVIHRDVSRQTQMRTFDVPPMHIFHFGTSREEYGEGETVTTSDSTHTAEDVKGIEFSAVCLPKGFAMFPTEHNAFLSNCDSAPAHLSYFRLEFGREGVPVVPTRLDSSSCEFPSTHPDMHGRGSRYTWMMANARGQGGGLPFRDVVKVDEQAARTQAQNDSQQHVRVDSAAQPKGGKCASADAASRLSAPATLVPPPAVSGARKVWFSHGIVGEPIFIPRLQLQRTDACPSADVAEDDGWLFVQCYVPEQHRTDLVILCARNPHEGPLATIHLRHHLCYGFHGTATPHVFVADSVDHSSVRAAAPPELRAKL